MAGDIVLASEILDTAWLGAIIPFPWSVYLLVTPHILRIRESNPAFWTSVSPLLGWIMDPFVVSTALSADNYLHGLCWYGDAHFTPDLLAKLLPQEEHT